eukprot:scaffold103617_cov15-Prasinocladus_malaysianus.AAC.1
MSPVNPDSHISIGPLGLDQLGLEVVLPPLVELVPGSKHHVPGLGQRLFRRRGQDARAPRPLDTMNTIPKGYLSVYSAQYVQPQRQPRWLNGKYESKCPGKRRQQR